MGSSGLALMGIGTAEGKGRARDAAIAALSSPLIDFPISQGAREPSHLAPAPHRASELRLCFFPPPRVSRAPAPQRVGFVCRTPVLPRPLDWLHALGGGPPRYPKLTPGCSCLALDEPITAAMRPTRRCSQARRPSPLLLAYSAATGIVFTITGSSEVTLQEVNEAAEAIYEMSDADANIIFGAQIDETMGSVLSVTVVATGFRE